MTPVIATALLFVMLMLSVVVAPGAMIAGLKALVTVGRALIVRTALAGMVLLPAFVVVMSPASILLVTVPGVLEVTSMVMTQVWPAGMVPPVKVTLPAKEVGSTPQLVCVMLATPAVVTPRGYVSVTVTPVMATALLLAILILSVVVPPGAMLLGLKALVTVGRALMVRTAVAAKILLPALVVVTAPMPMLLVTVPGVLEVTSMVMVQVCAAGIVPLVSVTLPAEEVGSTPQLVCVMLGVPAVVTPAG